MKKCGLCRKPNEILLKSWVYSEEKDTRHYVDGLKHSVGKIVTLSVCPACLGKKTRFNSYPFVIDREDFDRTKHLYHRPDLEELEKECLSELS